MCIRDSACPFWSWCVFFGCRVRLSAADGDGDSDDDDGDALACSQVMAMRVLMTKDDEPKCAGLALVRFKEREGAARALENLPEHKAREPMPMPTPMRILCTCVATSLQACLFPARIGLSFGRNRSAA